MDDKKKAGQRALERAGRNADEANALRDAASNAEVQGKDDLAAKLRESAQRLENNQ